MVVRDPVTNLTLGDIKPNATLHFFCGTDVRLNLNGCRHSGRMTVSDAIQRWGAQRMLYGLPVKCGKCGLRYIILQTDWPDTVLGRNMSEGEFRRRARRVNSRGA